MDTAVALVKTYLEISGYFVLAELPVRAAHKGGFHDVTDIDVIAVRFPHRQQHLDVVKSRPQDVLLGFDRQLESLEDGLDVIVGEVKESEARLNPALRKEGTVALALRRVGCCPEEMVEAEARLVVQAGHRDHVMPGGMRCRIRLVAFGGHGATHSGHKYVSLQHCASYIANRLHEAREALGGTQFKDPTLALFALQEKLAGHRS